MGAALSIFPALAEMQARSKLMNAQAASEGFRGQEFNLANQRFGQENQTAAVLGAMGGPVGVPVPGGQPFVTPQPGQASQPAMDPWSTVGGRPSGGVRVPQPFSSSTGGQVMTGRGGSPPGITGSSVGIPGSPGVMDTAGSNGPVDDMGRPSDLPQAAQPPGQLATPAAQPATGAHKWAAQPGEQFDTPDGSRPRLLQEVVAALRKANPKASNEVIGRAAMAYLPWMTEEDQVQLKQAQMETTRAVHEADAAARADNAQLRADTQTAIADEGNKTRLAAVQARIQAAKERADQVNARSLKIAADVNQLGQDKLEEARRTGNGRLALQAQKELRLQQNSITQLQDTYNRAMSNAQYVPQDQQESYIKNATQALETGLDALRNLPDPTGGQGRPAQKPGWQRGTPPTGAQQKQHPSFEESQRLFGNP